MTDFSASRNEMVDHQLIPKGIKDEAVLHAMRAVPRELFVAEADQDLAYMDGPLGIGHGQTISQPYIVALMAELLELTPEKTVLEIGTGSGYAAAVLSLLAKEVYTVERYHSLAKQAEERFFSLGYDNVFVQASDGTAGWKAFAPYDAILVSAGAPHIPNALKQQLNLWGKLVIPLGNTYFSQCLVQVTKVSEDEYDEKRIIPVRFVPLVGKDGWENS
ncbi:MAG: protein-L-isoaspartate(D-aspartate) O-methyltransferase [Anaerolineae bacterium]|jgi:protein-L-isoaspartate(D-aspartate) O-methyltransferase|nr:protein-L-isoaspartate(D-aspartate) O-methyltransferase [Anaerolineae bacterium]